MTAVVRAEELTYDYPGTRALDDVSFEIEAGTITAMVGPNGAGKTTLLRCLAALEAPLYGRVEIDGLDTTEAPRECHARLGYLSDFFGVYEDLSVRRCLLFHGAIRGLRGADLDAALERTVEQLKLGPLLDQKAGTLSRGQRQRLGIGQAIVHRPRLLLLDEPASGLDPEARWELSALIADLAKGGMTLVVSSHILAELEDYSTHVMIVREGRLALFEPVREAARRMKGTSDGITCVRVDFAEPQDAVQSVIEGYRGVTRVTVHGASASVFLPDSNEARGGLLKHLVDAGLPVIAYGEDKARVQEIYMSMMEAESAAPDGEGGDA